MITFLPTRQFEKTYENLNKIDQERIAEKLKYLSSHPNIFTVIKKLNDLEPATHRLRIGSFRIILKLESKNKNNTTFLLVKIGHRRNVYT